MNGLDVSLACEMRRDGQSTYGREVGHCLLPNGTVLAISHEYGSDEINRALVAYAWVEWKKELGE